MSEVLVIKVASDALDNMTLLLTELAIIISSFSAGASILLLTDYFKRHGWQYHKKKGKRVIND
jgi:hypothetical protein